MKEISSSAMVVGAGISGVRSALDLAEMGYQVTVIDRAPNLGGVLTQLDNQFPDDHCGMCKMLPLVDRDASSQFCLRKGFFHEKIDLLLSTELIALEGEPGRFQATLKQRNNGVNPDLCIGCGDCVEVCPEEIPDLFNLGLGNQKAIYLPIPHNIPNKYQIDFDACTKCGDCIEACPTDAIQISGGPVEQEILLQTGSVILGCGTEYFDPKTGKDTYGYSEFPDVVTSREFERILSGTGPTKGALVKPSDGKPIKKVAWFQCVGSRDVQVKSEQCSSICCMHAIKEARLVKKKAKDEIDCTIFYMDMRTFGKSFQRYRDEAEIDYGLKFTKARIHTVGYDEEKGSLAVQYLSQDGVINNENFDMIVLSIGQKPSSAIADLAEASGVSINQWGFCQTKPFSSTATEKEGVLLSGSASGLKDIGDSVIQASAAALGASKIITQNEPKSTEAEIEEEVILRDVSKELPKILTVICNCGKTSTEHINQENLIKNLKRDPAVADVVFIEKTCTQDGWLLLKEKAEEIQPNRILVGACLPHAYIRKFKELAEEIKLSPALIDVIDLRTSGFNSTQNEAIQSLVESTIKAGVSKLKRIDPFPATSLPIIQRALVIGGGISGITAALAIAENGYEVDLVESSDSLGGNLSWIKKTIEGEETAALLEDRIAKIENNALITLHTSSQIENVFGEAGRFYSVLTRQEEQDPLSLEHGTVVIATGGQEAVTESYLKGQSDAIMTQKQFAQKISDSSLDPKALEVVVMLQCVDSRKEPRNYCSRICCVSALKNALLIKKANPETRVFIFYRDLMSFGSNEIYYQEARNQGVVFIQYDLNQEPEVEIVDGKVQITANEPILGREILIESNLLVLATGVVPNEHEEIDQSLKIKADSDGFFQEAESKWRPVDSLKEGVFACGLAHSPRSITESITTAEAAASRAVRILKDKQLASGKIVAEIRQILCSKCERCLSACPYEARTIHPETGCIEVNPLMCQGCGSCAAVCPNSASILSGFQDQQMFEIVDSALSGLNV